jgi:protein gp37
MENSKIAWTDHTFNPWWGCVKVSDGCKNCYAATFSKRTGQDIWGVDKPRRFFADKHWAEPLKWNKEAGLAGKRMRVFCASMADVFEYRSDLEEPRKRLFELMRITPNLDWLVLTKRPENIGFMMRHFSYMPNLWLGTTVERQNVASDRLEHLLENDTAIHFVSVEPQLEQIDLSIWLGQGMSKGLDWVISGGESGAGCRPFDPDWARSLREQCKYNGVAFFMKQLGGVRDHHAELTDLPEDLRIREFPDV